MMNCIYCGSNRLSEQGSRYAPYYYNQREWLCLECCKLQYTDVPMDSEKIKYLESLKRRGFDPEKHAQDWQKMWDILFEENKKKGEATR